MLFILYEDLQVGYLELPIFNVTRARTLSDNPKEKEPYRRATLYFAFAFACHQQTDLLNPFCFINSISYIHELGNQRLSPLQKL